MISRPLSNLSRLAAGIAVVLAASAGAAQPPQASIDGRLDRAFGSRPRADGTGLRISAASHASVVIGLTAPADAAMIARLEKAGAQVARRSNGTAVARGNIVAATVDRPALARVAALPGVLRVELDGQLFPAPRPLDYTNGLIAAHDVWEASSPALPPGAVPPGRDGVPVSGAGITVCDIDSGIDPFHPMMFRADGGYYDWVDVDGDEAFDPGVDAVDFGDGQPVTLQTLNLPITEFWTPEPTQGSDDPAYAIGLDYLFADQNGSGARESGVAAGFTESSPTYGEPLLVADDVDGDGTLELGEKVVALGTSKIRAFRLENQVYRRGENLIETPVIDDFAHGMGATGIVAGGQPGFSHLIGVAPDAEIIMVSNQNAMNDFVLMDFCVDEGSRVVLHEYAPWMGYHLDGSSMLEQAIDDTAEAGIAHINPAGNLSTSEKLFKRTLPAGATTDVAIAVDEASPYAPFRLIGLSVLWRDVSRDLELTLTDPAGNTAVLTGHAGVFQAPFGAHDLFAFREDSERGTARVDAYVYSETMGAAPLEHGGWTLHVVDPESPDGDDLELIAYVLDDVSGWGKGIHFPEYASEDHLIGYPGTADNGLAVAAYTGHGFSGTSVPGERAPYSGRGRRIDGMHILSISAPDDPITAGTWSDHAASYVLYGGTSGASPHVAGTAALLLSVEPELDGLAVRQRIRFSSEVNEVVGAVPNDDYGYGKLRAYETVFGASPAGGNPPSITVEPVSAVESGPATVQVEIADDEDAIADLAVDVDRDYDGQYEERLSGLTFDVEPGSLGTTHVNVRVVDTTGKTARSLAAVTFTAAEPVAPPVEAPPVQTPEEEGCGCRVGSDAGPGSARWLVVAAFVAFAARIRRRRSTRDQAA